MDVVKEIKVKQFNSLIRSGCPIKIETYKRYEYRTIYAIVKKNEGSVLHYVFIESGEVREHSVPISEIESQYTKIELLTDPLKS